MLVQFRTDNDRQNYISLGLKRREKEEGLKSLHLSNAPNLAILRVSFSYQTIQVLSGYPAEQKANLSQAFGGGLKRKDTYYHMYIYIYIL